MTLRAFGGSRVIGAMFVNYTHPRQLRDPRKRHLVSKWSGRPRRIYLDPKRPYIRSWSRKADDVENSTTDEIVHAQQSPDDLALVPLQIAAMQVPEPERMLSQVDPFSSFPSSLSQMAAQAINYCQVSFWETVLPTDILQSVKFMRRHNKLPFRLRAARIPY